MTEVCNRDILADTGNVLFLYLVLQRDVLLPQLGCEMYKSNCECSIRALELSERLQQYESCFVRLLELRATIGTTLLLCTADRALITTVVATTLTLYGCWSSQNDYNSTTLTFYGS